MEMPLFSEGCVVCKSATLVGDISIGSGTVIHPLARIIAKTGPIIIGDNNIIEETVEIVNDGPDETVMIIGSSNMIQVGARLFCLKMGNNNMVDSKSIIGRHTVLSYGCIVSAGWPCFQFYTYYASLLSGIHLDTKEILPEMTIVYLDGDKQRRKITSQKVVDVKPEVELLAKIIPNHHQIHETETFVNNNSSATKETPKEENINERKSNRPSFNRPDFSRIKSILNKNKRP